MTVDSLTAGAEIGGPNRLKSSDVIQEETLSNERIQAGSEAGLTGPLGPRSESGSGENLEAELRLVRDVEASADAGVKNYEAAGLKGKLGDTKESHELAFGEQTTVNEQLVSLESQIRSLLSLIEAKDQEIERLQQSLEFFGNQSASSTPFWANPLELAFFGVIVLLVALIQELANRLRQQARSGVNGSIGLQAGAATQTIVEKERIREKDSSKSTATEVAEFNYLSDADHSSQLGESGRPEQATFDSSDRQAWDISDEPCDVDPDSEVRVSMGLGIDEEPDKIDTEEIQSETDPVSHPLDLARAYVEMGFSEAAKAELIKVIVSGSPADVLEAERLLDRLAN